MARPRAIREEATPTRRYYAVKITARPGDWGFTQPLSHMLHTVIWLPLLSQPLNQYMTIPRLCALVRAHQLEYAVPEVS